MNRMWWTLIISILVAGCSSGDSDQDPKAAAKESVADAEVPAETVFDPMVGTIDRAKSVDAVSGDRMNELNKQLDESE